MSQEASNTTKRRRKICCGCLREFDEDVQLCPVDNGPLTPLYFDHPQLDEKLGNSLKIQSLISERRSARIFLCETKRGVLHALKLLKRNEQRYVQAFLQEGQMLSKLSHPRLVHLHAAGMLGTDAYMLLEYLPGGSLAKILEPSKTRNSTLPFKDVARIVSQVSEALIYLHRQNIAYPILKPEHVMFRDDSLAESCLIDLSRTYFAHDNRTVSIGGAIFLNPHYSAPETLMGREPTIMSSVYSIACLVHRCLTGKTLFEGRTDLQLASKHMSERPQIAWVEMNVPPSFATMLNQALAKSPTERPSVEDIGMAADKLA